MDRTLIDGIGNAGSMYRFYSTITRSISLRTQLRKQKDGTNFMVPADVRHSVCSGENAGEENDGVGFPVGRTCPPAT